MLVSGTTKASFTPNVNGNYAVIVDNGICSDTSACFPITQVGINEKTNENISIHPNPTNSTFAILGIDQSDFSSIEILDITDKLLFNTNSPINIDLSNYENGAYLFRIIGDKNYTGKIVNE